MPYIAKTQRPEIDNEINTLIKAVHKSTIIPADKHLGVVNYIISRVIMGILQPSNYGEMASAVGTLECVKLEMYRRLIGPYEDEAILKNGDIEEYYL